MRTTLEIDDDVLEAVKDLAKAKDSTAGKVISALARQAMTRASGEALIERNGFLVLPSRGAVVTSAHVRRLEEESDLRDAGLFPKD